MLRLNHGQISCINCIITVITVITCSQPQPPVLYLQKAPESSSQNTAPLSTMVHCTALQRHALLCTALHCTELNFTTLHCSALSCIYYLICSEMKYNAIYFTALHRNALHCIKLPCTAVQYTALHCPALHCTALHCTALHCTVHWGQLRLHFLQLCGRSHHVELESTGWADTYGLWRNGFIPTHKLAV